jgi:hypothetical protein
MTWASLDDAGNGIPRVLWVLVLEWPLFMGAAWYLSEVMDAGTGVRRPPLFFLESCFSQKVLSCISVMQVLHPTL